MSVPVIWTQPATPSPWSYLPQYLSQLIMQNIMMQRWGFFIANWAAFRAITVDFPTCLPLLRTMWPSVSRTFFCHLSSFNFDCLIFTKNFPLGCEPTCTYFFKNRYLLPIDNDLLPQHNLNPTLTQSALTLLYNKPYLVSTGQVFIFFIKLSFFLLCYCCWLGLD